MKMATIRELLTVAVTQALQQGHTLKSVVVEIVEYILSNSTLVVSSPDDSIYLKEGNCFGIGDSNKDRELQTPRFCVFSFTNLKDCDSINCSWRLKSMPDFQSIEEYIRSNRDDNTNIVVLEDAVPLKFSLVKDTNSYADIWIPESVSIQWEKPVYKLNYKKDNGVYEEKFNSRNKLESRMLQLISNNAEKLRAFCSMDSNKHLGFRVAEYVYQSGGKPEITDKNAYIIWDSLRFKESEGVWNEQD